MTAQAVTVGARPRDGWGTARSRTNRVVVPAVTLPRVDEAVRVVDRVRDACRDGQDRVREALDDPAVTGSADPAVLRHAGRAWMDHAARVEASLRELGYHLDLS